MKWCIRGGESIDGGGIEDGDLVGEVRPIGGCNQAANSVGKLGMEPGVLVSAAVGGKDALMLADARRIRLGVLSEVREQNLPSPADGGSRRDRKRHPAGPSF